jgi:hypothetical protein
MGTYPNMQLWEISRTMDSVVTQAHVDTTTKSFDGMEYIFYHSCLQSLRLDGRYGCNQEREKVKVTKNHRNITNYS